MPNVFRWNIARREQLGRLVTGESVEGLPWILEEVRRCAARVIAMAGDSQLVFVGRSPEALFDYLTGRLRVHRGPIGRLFSTCRSRDRATVGPR